MESTKFHVVYMMMAVGLVVSGGVGLAWACLKGDVQGGFTMGGYIATVQAMWMAALFSKWSQE